jgi:hypothetical protein
LKQGVNAGAGQRQQGGVEGQDAQVIADPNLPAGDRFGGHDLHLAFFDVARQGPARQPQRRKPEQRRDGAERVGQDNLR